MVHKLLLLLGLLARTMFIDSNTIVLEVRTARWALCANGEHNVFIATSINTFSSTETCSTTYRVGAGVTAGAIEVWCIVD
jgi:hypothetical protein